MPFVAEPGRAPEERTYFADDAIHILCIGKYEIRKHHLLLLQAVEELIAEHKAGATDKRIFGEIKLTLIGEATNHFQKEYCEQVRRYVSEHHMEDIVTVKTNVPRDRMEAEYLAADVYVIPSTREMASVSQLEAMSYSLPVICSDTNGTACYVEDGVTGYQFKDCDQTDLRRKLEIMLSDRERMKAMGAAGYRMVIEKYNFENYYNTIMLMRDKIL